MRPDAQREEGYLSERKSGFRGGTVFGTEKPLRYPPPEGPARIDNAVASAAAPKPLREGGAGRVIMTDPQSTER